MNSPEDGPVGPKHVEIRRYTNKIETMTSVGFSLLIPYPAFCNWNQRVIYMKTYDDGCQRILVCHCLAKISVRVKEECNLYKG